MTPASATRLELLRRIARQAMQQRGLLPDFGTAALAQSAAISAPARDADSAVRDLRALLWCSIDNDDSMDLDQLSVAEALAAGATRVRVAIADVDALVARGSPLDDHARANTTSVYTAAQIFPLLPERLSTDLTSLAAGQERLALVIEMTVAMDGSVTASALYRARVVNRAKLAYNAVAAWLAGTAPAPAALAAVPGMGEQLRLQDQVARALRALRFRHGALGLSTLEARPVFEGGALLDLRPDEDNAAKQLIEDFMIAANGATARFLADQGLPALRRVLPPPERWDRIVALAGRLGERLPSVPSSAALNDFLNRRRAADAATFPDLSLSVVKLLGRGQYVADPPDASPPGHFGLAVADYGHATAPNRRFPDIVMLRLVKSALRRAAAPYTPDELRAIADHCTLQEDNAAKVERWLRKSAAALLLSARIGQTFDAIVTGASPSGTWARISAPTAEGRIVRGFAGLDVGDHVRVALLSTDIERGYIDFATVSSKP